jgi:hypothetical protein
MRPGNIQSVAVQIKDGDKPHTRLKVQPTMLGRTKERSGSILRPRRQLTTIGIPYERSRSTTDAETIALKALEEPRKMRPNIVTRARFR